MLPVTLPGEDASLIVSLPVRQPTGASLPRLSSPAQLRALATGRARAVGAVCQSKNRHSRYRLGVLLTPGWPQAKWPDLFAPYLPCILLFATFRA